MPGILLTSIEYGGYVSIVKFVIFVILFFVSLPLINWVYQDARNIGAKTLFWTPIIFAAVAAATLIWLIVPVFIVGLLLYLIALIATSLSYARHRDSKVPDYQRVLTAEFLKGLFSKKEAQTETVEDLIFITANNNQVPVPETRSSDYAGYKSAHDILSDAAYRRASNIFFAPTHQQDYSITYYIDGAATKQPPRTKDQIEPFIHFVKNLADLNPSEKRKPQKGYFKIRKNEENTEWQVITAGSTAGEQVKIKQLSQQAISNLTDIGLTKEQYAQLDNIGNAKQGLFIVAGPKKTGVTTTFYSLLKKHDPYMYTVTTLERRPSEQLPNIAQNTFALSDTGTTTYAKKLKALLGTGPNVIGVADCTDSETAQIVCNAAKDGRIVYLTLEAENVIKALSKWIQLVGDKDLVAETLLGISNQRLLRKLCDKCKQAYEPKKELLKKFNIPAEKAKVLHRPAKAQPGKHKSTTCQNCQGTGFFGRTSVFEIITINDHLRNVIKQAKSTSEIGTEFRRAKMLYLQEQAMKKIIAGITSINEMVRVFSSAKKKKKIRKS